MNIELFEKGFPILLKSSSTPMLNGERGVGKTQFVRDYCERNGHFFHPLYLGQAADSGDLIGLQHFVEDENGKVVGTQHVMMDWMRQAIDFAEKNPDKYAIIFLDEFNRAPKDVIQAMFNFILLGELNGVQCPPNVKPVAAQNPPTEDYDVLDMDDSALYDRFLFLDFKPTPKDFYKYANERKFNPAIIEFLQEDVASLEPKGKDYSMDDFVKPSRRSWEKVDELEKLLEESDLDNVDKSNLFLEFASGLVGPTVAMQYNQFTKNYDRAIDADLILKDYSKVRDKVLKAVNSEVVRTDLIVNAANSLKQKIHEKTKLITRKEEANVVAFFKDLINDNTVETAYGIVRDLLTDTTSENFLKTVRDKEKGFASNPDLVSAFDPYMEMLKNAKKNRDEG